MGLVDYISRQPNQKAKVTSKYDEEFAVATITLISDVIAAICINSTPLNCQSQHLKAGNHTHISQVQILKKQTFPNCFLP